MLKRTFDIVASFFGLILLAPLFAMIGAAIKRDSPGPIFYRGERIGRDGVPFSILKFRTMRESPEAYEGPKITAKGDVRITRLGQFLRDSKLNELPQLVNVLRGEMSLVGPRPEDPAYVEHYSPEQREVLSVRPGITSLASVIYNDEEKMLSGDDFAETYLQSILPDKLRLDLIYVRNLSFLLDMDILFRTFTIFLPRVRRATLHADDVLVGPFRVMRRLVTWFSIDAVIASIAVALATLVWRLAEPLNFGIPRAALVAFGIAAVFTLTNALTGVQKVQWRYASASEAVGVFFSVLISTGILLVANTLVPEPNLPTGMLLIAATFSLAGFLGVRYRRRLAAGLSATFSGLRRTAEIAREQVIVVGSGEAGQIMIWLLQNSPSARAFHVVGVVDDDYTKIGTLLHGVPVLGTSERLADFVENFDVGLIVFAIHSISPERRREILARCWATGARTIVAPDFLTFLHADTHETQDSAWVPPDSDFDVSEAPLVNRELYQVITLLADLARMGEYARVTEKLIQLEGQIKGRNGESSHQPTADS